MSTPKPPYQSKTATTPADQEPALMRLGLMAQWYATLISTDPTQIGDLTHAACRVSAERALTITKVCEYAGLDSTDPLVSARVGHAVDDALHHYRNPGQLSPRDAATRALFA